MTTIEFESIKFINHDNKVEAVFMKQFHFYLENKSLKNIAPFKVENSKLIFQDTNESRVKRKFQQLLTKGFESLTTRHNNKPATYIHKLSNIPLIGSNAFGLVDRNTNIIELKPITGCNIKCVYCSVDEDKRTRDMVVEADYLIEEFQKLVEFKQTDNIEAHIGGQAEPTLYADLIPLCKGLSKMPQVKTISIDTNAILLSKPIVDKLIKAGLNRVNFSLNAINPEKAKKIADFKVYDVKKVQDIIRYTSDKIKVIIAPVWVPNINDKGIEDIIEFYKTLNKKNTTLGIQNFLRYTKGRNPAKPMDYDTFFEKLKALEKKHNVKLIVSEEDFQINKTKALPKPFRKGNYITAEVKCRGRFKNEYIAVKDNRSITFTSIKPVKDQVRLKITHDKHNVFYGELV